MRLPDIFKNPRVAAVMGVVLGLALGLLVGWALWPVEYTDALPEILRQDYQEEYLRMAIDSYGRYPDPELAARRWLSLGKNAVPLLVAISRNPGSQDVGDILAFKAAIEDQLGGISAAPSPPRPAAFPSTTTKILVIALGSLLALGVIGWAVYRYVARPILYGRRSSTGEISAARQAQEIARATEKTDFGRLGYETPIAQVMTTYVLGDDLYDQSFSIDSPSGDFLGEYGVGISDTMVSGEPKKVTAIEVWLFDKNDIKTATKVLMSQYAYNDPAIRSRLEAKGELVLIQPQAQVMLETATLQLLATVVDLQYGYGNLPEQSYFERVTLELAVWPKK